MPVAPPLPPGPVSWRQLYTLNPEGSTVNFDVQAFRDPEQLVRILVPVLQSVDQNKLGHAMNVCNVSLFLLRNCSRCHQLRAPRRDSCARVSRKDSNLCCANLPPD
jgi:symplekin